MKVLFVHDHIFKYSASTFYSSGGLPSSIWPRYTSFFESLTVIGRNGGSLVSGDTGFTLSSAKNVNFELLPNLATVKNFIYGNKEAKKRVKALVSQHDAVIARLPSRLGVLFVKEAIRQNKPYALEIVGCPWDALWNYGNLKGKVFAPYAWLELKLLASKTNYALYVTESFLQRRYPVNKNAIQVFCSNVEIPKVEPIFLEQRLQKIAQLNADDTVTFGLVANYSSRYKGIDVAIKALKQANLPKWQFKVLGYGDASYYEDLARNLGVADKVHFVGSLPSGEPVFDWLDSIDIYLHPSFQEGLPRALAEAMSRGLPSLASGIAGIPELLGRDELINAGDYMCLADKIVKMVGDKNYQLSQASKNFVKAGEYYKETLDERRASFWQSFYQYVAAK